jgi:hypothetical protein
MLFPYARLLGIPSQMLPSINGVHALHTMAVKLRLVPLKLLPHWRQTFTPPVTHDGHRCGYAGGTATANDAMLTPWHATHLRSRTESHTCRSPSTPV